MDNKHEMALKTYEALQKRRKKKELQHKRDIAESGWNGVTTYTNKRNKRYYDRRRTSI